MNGTMQRNENLDVVVKEFSGLLDELRIVSYETHNKLNNPRYFFMIKEAEEKGLELSLQILETHINTLNEELGNRKIENIHEYVKNYKKEFLEG